MANRRMFSMCVVDTDDFLDMPASAQCLYFHLGMRADDDGFVASPKRITFLCNASTDDLKLLAAKHFIVPFESGVCVIRDWRINNYIQKDRYRPTTHLVERNSLSVLGNGAYEPSNSSVYILDTNCTRSIGKDSIGKDSINSCCTEQALSTPKHNDNDIKFTSPTVEEVRAYCEQRQNGIDPEHFCDYYAAKGWMVGKSPMTSWRIAIKNWERRDRKKQSSEEKKQTRESKLWNSIEGGNK